jgi:PRTRC genetic system protein E
MTISLSTRGPFLRCTLLYSILEANMIRELKPLLSSRALTLTVASVGDGRIRVNVFPTKIGSDENPALREPLSVEGSAEELDAELPGVLVEYVATHLTIRQSLEKTKAEMQAAEKAAKEEVNAKKNKLDPKKSISPATKVEEKKPEEAPKAEPARARSLFDTAPVEDPGRASNSGNQLVEISHKEFEEEMMAEINEAKEDEGGEVA